MENEALRKMVEEEKSRLKEVNCECLAEHDEVIAAKDAEIKRLKRKLWACGVGQGLQARDSGSRDKNSSRPSAKIRSNTFSGRLFLPVTVT